MKAREDEAAAPLDFCLGFHPGILVFVKVKRGSPVLPCHARRRDNVAWPCRALWRGSPVLPRHARRRGKTKQPRRSIFASGSTQAYWFLLKISATALYCRAMGPGAAKLSCRAQPCGAADLIHVFVYIKDFVTTIT
jgi:hypothetical protein